MGLRRGLLTVGVVAAASLTTAAQDARQTAPPSSSNPVYLDPSQPLDRRVDDLISKLTPAEKGSLLGTTAPAIDRLKIPAMNGWNQSLHGIVWTRPTTMFPVPIGMSATWDTPLEHDVASAIGDEGRAVNNYWPTIPGPTAPSTSGQLMTRTPDGDYRHNGLVYRSPVINISRHPLWGRIDEAFGEDPYLTSRMTVAFVKGTQGDNPTYLKLATTLKHFAVNNQEIGRHSLSATVSERLLMEYFLPHFKAGIVEGGATSIMSSYNRLNGVINTENTLLLKDVLRDKWQFKGFVVPDSGATEDMVRSYMKYATLEEATAAAIKAGSDLDNSAFIASVPGALAKGLLTERDLDGALRHVLSVRFRLGEFDPPAMNPYTKIPASVIDSHRALALRAARESIVLLTNKNNFLPFNRSAIKRIAIVGPYASTPFMGIGYTGLASRFVVPLEGIRNVVAPGTEVMTAPGAALPTRGLGAGRAGAAPGGANRSGAGADLAGQAPADPEAVYAEAVAAAKNADVAIVFVGTNAAVEAEGLDRTYLGLPPAQEELARRVFAANPKTVLVILNGGPIAVPWEKENLPAVIDMFIAGEEGGNAIADVLFGNYNPAGRLPYTVYASHEDVPPMDEYDITKGFTYMYFAGTPVYPFGHGLSYSTFTYSNLTLSSKTIAGGGAVTVRVTVRNSGTRAGDDVPQLYVRDLHARVKRPKLELRGFERVSLKPGEQRTITFTLPAEKLAFWDETTHAFVTEPGPFEVLVGASSQDIRLRGQFDVTSRGQWPY
jgi:beta-glucosidase